MDETPTLNISGYKTDTPHHIIVIGEGAVACEDYELVIKLGEREYRTKMTEHEHSVIYGVLQRATQRVGRYKV